MGYMFNGAKAFSGDLSGWNVLKVFYQRNGCQNFCDKAGSLTPPDFRFKGEGLAGNGVVLCGSHPFSTQGSDARPSGKRRRNPRITRASSVKFSRSLTQHRTNEDGSGRVFQGNNEIS